MGCSDRDIRGGVVLFDIGMFALHFKSPLRELIGFII